MRSARPARAGVNGIVEIHGHGRTIREGCDHCMGLGWLETGADAIPVTDIVLSPEGHPKWIAG